MLTAALDTYYTSRPTDGDFSEYWGIATDPDGVTRDRLSEAERLKYLENVEEELGFAWSLIPGRVLDYGCGPGWFLRELSNAWQKFGKEPAERAAEELEKHGIIPHVACEPGYYDLVVCYHVIEHCIDPESVIQEIHRMLRPGGWLILGTPDFASPCAVRFGRNYRMLHDKTHCSLFTNESMHRFLRDFGFTIRRVRYPFPLRYATPATWDRWHDTSKVSPPWPGNWMTFYCQAHD